MNKGLAADGAVKTPELYYEPGHYYSPVPSISDLKAREQEIFCQIPNHIPGIDLQAEKQLGLLDKLAVYYREQPWSDNNTAGLRFYFENNQFRHSDAIFLFMMLRYMRPKKIIEVGSGFSSACMMDTNERFFENRMDLSFVDPDCSRLNALINESDKAKPRIYKQRVQEVDQSLFTALSSGDLLFIDSSHVTKTGSDVNHLVFEILPRLRSGVYVHFHDIFYPFEYPKEWIYEGWGMWSEAYLLKAFLQFNAEFEITLFTSMIAERYPSKLIDDMPLCAKGYKASLYLRRK